MRTVFLAFATVPMWWAGSAAACPFCTTAKTGNGYLAATVVLLALPLAAICGLVLWVRRCTRATVEPSDGETDSSPSAAS